MEMLADHGNGNYAYIDSEREAEKVLVREASSTLHTIAKDVKLQVEFNPAEVSAYRLIGYENRILAARDFNDDTKDAGEIGAGHTVTALYEVVPTKAHAVAADPLREVDPLKYQSAPQLSSASQTEELMTVKVRYKDPDGSRSKLLSHAVPVESQAWNDASEDFRFAMAVSMFGLHLRGSEVVEEFGIDRIQALAAISLGEDEFGDRAELLDLIRRYRNLAPGA
jgi:Ca-activated chloride channel family protein